LTLLIAPLNAA